MGQARETDYAPGGPEGTIVTPRTRAILGGLLLLLLFPAAGPARAADAGAIATGSPGSTATRLGQDVADLARRFGVALEVVPSPGGPANLEALAQRPGTLLAIVPSDTLDFLATFAGDPELRRRAELLQVAAPLHREEVHVLARPGIATFADLQGKRVAVGAPDSGTLVTATLLLGVAGVMPAEELRLGDAAALAALRAGRIDAMIHVAGQPAPLLKDTVAIEDALHLVPVDQPALRQLYPAAAIPAGAYYPWQPEAVPTVAPRAVLVTSRWSSEEGAACRLVGKVARVIADNLDRLRREGHPKWREVDLAAGAPAGWERSPCVEQALRGPEGYVLEGPEEEATPPGTPPATLSISTEARPAPQEGPARRGDAAAAPSACAAEGDPFRRQLCEVRRQLGAER
jgi:TRAP transporter TAXI family solute receptor